MNKPACSRSGALAAIARIAGTGHKQAQVKLAKLVSANDRNTAVTYFTDFAPTQLFVQQGLMVKLPTPGSGLK
jgi:ribonuclease BN (tRNA processing enzyme)